MNRPSRDNVLNFRAKALPAVITMPSRFGGAEGRGAAAMQAPGSSAHGDRKTSAILAMPSRGAQHRTASVVEMPSRGGDAEEVGEASTLVRPQPLGFADGLRMTLVALFALLGWPRPTHGKDPGAAGARPWKVELLNVISRLQLPAPATAGRAAARSTLLEFPQPVAEENLSAEFARAA